ncbi:MAG: hypothetical protein ACFE9C_02935 [Candidatus Hodarchaeota archaeon]
MNYIGVDVGMKSYKEIIKNDNFNAADQYFVDTKLYKMCWGCERKRKSGHMVWDTTKLRRIFFCEDCFTTLKK